VRVQATEAWLNDPVFNGHYHETGYIIAASKPENVKMLYETERPTRERGFVELCDAEAFRKTMPFGVLTGDLPNWHGWYKASGAGWTHARNALTAAAMEAERLGARLICGSPNGKVTELVLGGDREVLGAKTADGEFHRADRTILCAGANAPQLLDMQDQLRPTAWTLAHIKMSAEEARLYKDLPVLFNVERGFFMEPDEDNFELKICDEHPGYCDWIADPKTGHLASVPFERQGIPRESEEGVRAFLRETMPHLSTRPFSFARICWCADTPDRAFLISPHPEHANLILAVGGSGHGFMQIPVIGKYIADCLEGQLDPRMATAWRWRPETAVNRAWKDTQGRFGGSNTVRDFQDVKEWTDTA
jgi:sarcosine oxidase/L-pipecolate oxidase